MVYTQLRDWAWLLVGLFSTLLLRQYRKNKAINKQRQRESLYFLGNLFFITANISITLYILQITGASLMSKNDMHTIVIWTQIFGILAIIIAGIVIGLILINIFDGKNTYTDDIGKTNADFRKRIERKQRYEERKTNIISFIKKRHHKS